MTLELKQYKSDFFPNSIEPYHLGGVESVVIGTEYDEETLSVTIFDRRVFAANVFEYIKDNDTGEYFVKEGKCVR